MIHRITILAALALAPRLLAAELPEIKVDRVFEGSAGGSFTVASQVQVDGKRVFLKSSRGGQQVTKYANFEADILAHGVFDRLGMKCPRARVVRLAPGAPSVYGRPLSERLGTNVLAMEFVDSRFAQGRLFVGHMPADGKGFLEQFIDLFLVDVLMGNGDRRYANLFVVSPYTEQEGAERRGTIRPIPIDNNAGFGTMTVWKIPTSQTNFLETYDGVSPVEVLKDLGSIRGIVHDSEVHNALVAGRTNRPKILSRAREVVRALDDAFFGALVDALPREVLPRGVELSLEDQPWMAHLTEKGMQVLFGGVTRKLTGKELFEHRKAELKRIFAWRRDHLLTALWGYFAELDRPAAPVKAPVKK